MALVKLIFFAFVFSQAVIFLEASDKNEGTSRIKGEKVEVEVQEDVHIFDEVEEELEILEEDEENVVVDEVEENVVHEVEGEADAAEGAEINEELNIVEIEDENAEKDKSDGNLSGGLLATRSDEERQDELIDNINMVEDLDAKLHDNFEGEREMEN